MAEKLIMRAPARKSVAGSRQRTTHATKVPGAWNKVYYKDARRMSEIPDDSINLIVTSPPYFSVKDYALDGYQKTRHSRNAKAQIGRVQSFDKYISELLAVWRECQRVLVPNGKLVVNVPPMPMLKSIINTHHNRHIFDISAEIQHSIVHDTGLYLMDIYVWNRTNPSKKLMFGSYPYPRNLYAQNTVEFITVYVKDGKPDNGVPAVTKRRSKISQKEWVTYTKQVWDIPVPNRGDSSFGKHPALMPEEIPNRCIRMFTYEGDTVMDPFCGSGTTLKIAKRLGRNYVGYEVIKSYKPLIDEKLEEA